MFACLWKQIPQQEKIQMIAIDTFFFNIKTLLALKIIYDFIYKNIQEII